MYASMQAFLDTLPQGAPVTTTPDTRYNGPGTLHLVRWIDIDGDRFEQRISHVLEVAPDNFIVARGPNDATPRAAARQARWAYALAQEVHESPSPGNWVKVLAELEWIPDTEVMMIKTAVFDGEGIVMHKYIIGGDPISHMQVDADFKIRD